MPAQGCVSSPGNWVASFELVVASLSCAELGTAQPQLVVLTFSLQGPALFFPYIHFHFKDLPPLLPGQLPVLVLVRLGEHSPDLHRGDHQHRVSQQQAGAELCQAQAQLC